ncbi:IS21 family transposase [Pseudoalteromonas rubra]|uniref:Transposase n=1 Tax=Pseudoalteromonas rubra TaxID=43658 RepID=A0A0F4QBF4_9GAMM|nr:IS21 family transposase [Pseudoalteromonas rubra]KJZ05006.1 transposase [Pseudoalteromonas rubra]
MPKKRTTMSKIRDVFRLKFDAKLPNRDVAHCLKFDAKLPNRDVAHCLKMGAATVSDLLGRFNTANLSWPLPDDLNDLQLEAALFPKRPLPAVKALPDFALIHQELKRKGMTKLLLWQEYLDENLDTAYQYTQYCALYQRWLKKQKRSMRQFHLAGDKLFIDYCGPTVPIVNPDTGEVRQAQIFVATLGASNYTYVEASAGQDQQSWLEAHANAFEFFGGVPRLLVPDNLKSAVTKADRYEPVLNENYQKLARHYQTAVMPARPYKPKDKAKAENAVLIVERWLLMRIRKQVFHTLAELNATLRALLKELNQRPFKAMAGNRQGLFEQLDKPALTPLPQSRYEYTDHKQAKVNIDYHVLYNKHAYSVPHQYVGERVSLEAGQRVVRIYHHNQCIARHQRSHKEYGFSTLSEHMPEFHQKQQWSPGRLLSWGQSIGPGCREVVAHQLNSKPHPEQAYRSTLGLLNLSRQYGEARLEKACQSALLAGKPQRQFIENLLKHKREDVTLSASQPVDLCHANVRGSHYYN